jgi:hypothetical protein
MSKELKAEKIRSTSARPSSAVPQHSRLASGATFLRKELIQNTYNGSPRPARASSAKTLTIRQISTVYDTEKPKKEHKITRPR